MIYDTKILNKQKIECFHSLVKDAIENLTFPCIEALVFKDNSILFHKAFGNIENDRALMLNSIFDIASITKPIVTATLILLLNEQKMLSVSDKVHKFITEFKKDSEKRKITIAHLLAHSSGLPAWKALYKNKTQGEGIKELVLIPLETPVGTKTTYSCLGYILLRLIIENITKTSIDKLAQKLIFKPLGMKDSFFNPNKKLLNKIVPTGQSLQRKYTIHADVHDDNSYFLGGIGGNAGLFSTAYDIFLYSSMILNNGQHNNKTFLHKESVLLMTTNAFEHLNLAPYGLGFQINKPNSAKELFTNKSFGHTGFTGTSLRQEPNSKLGIILLTNRVYLSYRGNIHRMKVFRIKAQNILIEAIN